LTTYPRLLARNTACNSSGMRDLQMIGFFFVASSKGEGTIWSKFVATGAAASVLVLLETTIMQSFASDFVLCSDLIRSHSTQLPFACVRAFSNEEMQVKPFGCLLGCSFY
jgi:hypothetical protein